MLLEEVLTGEIWRAKELELGQNVRSVLHTQIHLIEHVEEAIVKNGMKPLHRAAVECMECPVGCGQLVKPRLLLGNILQSEHIVRSSGC